MLSRSLTRAEVMVRKYSFNTKKLQKTRIMYFSVEVVSIPAAYTTPKIKKIRMATSESDRVFRKCR